jgi:hypothetical protein
MNTSLRVAVAILLSVGAIANPPSKSGARAQEKARPAYRYGVPPNATRCDIMLPIQIELIPLNPAEPGQTAQFQIRTASRLDPDQVKNIWIEYDVPQRLRRPSTPSKGMLAKTGRSVFDLAVYVPDPAPYAIRARMVVELTDGSTISKTVTQWINVGPDDTPGMTRRFVDPDGSGIRVYQGATVRQ